MSAAAVDYSDWTDLLAEIVTPDGKVDYEALSARRDRLDRVIAQIAAISPDSAPERFPGEEHALGGANGRRVFRAGRAGVVPLGLVVVDGAEVELAAGVHVSVERRATAVDPRLRRDRDVGLGAGVAAVRRRVVAAARDEATEREHDESERGPNRARKKGHAPKVAQIARGLE